MSTFNLCQAGDGESPGEIDSSPRDGVICFAVYYRLIRLALCMDEMRITVGDSANEFCLESVKFFPFSFASDRTLSSSVLESFEVSAKD